MKSLHKTFDILEYIALQDGKKVTPSEAAAFTGLNPATTTRIMGELTKRGYLEQVSRKEGYLPGPMCAALGSRMNVYTRLADAAGEPLKKLSAFIQMPVNLSVLYGGNRIMLRFSGPDGWTPWKRFLFPNEKDTATLPLLLAFTDRKKSAGPLPEDITQEMLSGLGKKGYVDTPDKDGRLRIMGHIIQAPGYPPAAFGCGVPKSIEHPKALEAVQETARAIQEKLAVKYNAY